MLAQLLRFLIGGQMLAGAALGHWLGAASVGLWGLVLGAFALPLLILTLITLASMLMSRASQEPAAMWWSALWGEWLAGVRIFLLRQPWTVAPPKVLPATAPQARLPVVLVHGYLCNHRIWDDMAQALRAQGHAVHAVNLEPVFASIDDYAPIVDAAVQALAAHSGQPRVALVGHSMGGLAIRAWMRANLRAHGEAAVRAQVAGVLTLGTPHVGTQLAKGATTPNGRQMLWKSDWLAQLTAQEPPALRRLLRIAITPQDNIVCPQRAQTLPDIQPVVFDGIGHLQMCTHPPLITWVAAQLAALDAPQT